MKQLAFLFLLLFFKTGWSQYNNPVASLMSTKLIQADSYIGDDNMGFDYFTKNNTLFKFKNGEKFQYKNIYLGKISKVDLQNPLRIILFYENFNTIIALDYQFNEIDKINLSEKNTNIIASAVGMASRNNYWVFNQQTQQLGLFNFKKKTLQPIGVPFDSPIKTYTSTYNLFIWIDQENQLHLCDIFGKTNTVGILPEYDTIYLTEETVLAYQKDGILYLFDLQKGTSTPVENIEKTFTSYTYKNQNLAIFTPEGITNYKINLP